MNHRSNEELEGHMNTGIEWPVYAYVGQQGEGEEVARLRAMLTEVVAAYRDDTVGYEAWLNRLQRAIWKSRQMLEGPQSK